MKTCLRLSVSGICGLVFAFVVLGEARADRIARWEVPSNVSGCSLAGARLTLRPDGTASWFGVVNSIYRDDAYCVTLTFLNSGGRKLFSWPRFCSQTLWQHPQVWTNNNLAFPVGQFNSIAIVTKRDHC